MATDLPDPFTRLQAALADRYRFDRELGQGGMATVYLVHNLKHDRNVALKVLRPELAAVLGRERFLNEIRLTARLDHPHILTLIDSGESDGFLWYVVPFIRGESLRQKLEREKQLGVEEALAIARQAASALDYAHRQGVIHRDIKPENILLQEGEAVLADFGVALAVKEAAGNRLTETGLSLGTPQYMSPEQAAGNQQVDARTDVYSLAAVLYELLSGEPPITGATTQTIIAKLMTVLPVPLRIVRATVPGGVSAAVDRALAKVPADRFPSAAEFAETLCTGEGAVQMGRTVPRATWAGIGARWRRLPATARAGIVATTGLAAALAMLAGIYDLAAPNPIEKFHALKGSRVILDFPMSPIKQFSATFQITFDQKDAVYHDDGGTWVLLNPGWARVTLFNTVSISVQGRPLMVDLSGDVTRGRAIVVLPGLPTIAGPDSLDRLDLEVLGLSISAQVPVVTTRSGDTLIVRLLSSGVSTQPADTTSRR